MKKEKKKTAQKKNTGGLLFSAVLVTAFMICSYFFMKMIDTVNKAWLESLLCILVFVVFGLFLFYATRVGDGKQVVRFSPATLIVMDLPALYIILAAMISSLPLSSEIVSCAPIIYLASIVLGYGIPYTFVSGYEIDNSSSADTVKEAADEELDDDEKFVVESSNNGEIVIKEDDDEDEIVNTEAQQYADAESKAEAEAEEKE